MDNQYYRGELETLLIKNFIPAGYKITEGIKLDSVPENSKYDALSFSLDGKKVVYRKGKITPDRPGAFLTIWQRPSLFLSAVNVANNNKPIPLTSNELEYLFIKVGSDSEFISSRVEENDRSTNSAKSGMFIFPVSLLIEKGIVFYIHK